MKIAGYVIVALLLVVLFQPWSYDRRGFADVRVAVAGGTLDFSLLDQANGKAYCLTSLFSTRDEPGATVAIAIDRIGTVSAGALSSHLAKSGTTSRLMGPAGAPAFFEGPSVRKLIFPSDEPVTVTGSIQYKGEVHRFETSLKLQHWEKDRKVSRYCV